MGMDDDESLSIASGRCDHLSNLFGSAHDSKDFNTLRKRVLSPQKVNPSDVPIAG